MPSTDSICSEVQKNQRNGYPESSQQCDYEIQYADHSSSLGVLIRDELQLTATNGSKTKFNFVFGYESFFYAFVYFIKAIYLEALIHSMNIFVLRCGYDQEGSLLNTLSKTDGIMGLSRAKVSLPYQLASKGLIKNVVGHCLSSDAVGGGYMFLGDDFVPNWGMTWVPMAYTHSS